MEYVAAAWDSHTKKNIDSLERIQNRAARFVSNTYGIDTSITSILHELNWPSLQQRRKCHRLTCFYKMLHGQLDVNFMEHISHKPFRNRRGHSQQFQQQCTNSDVFANSFFNRTVTDWNKLLPETVSQSSIPTFTHALLQDPSMISKI